MYVQQEYLKTYYIKILIIILTDFINFILSYSKSQITATATKSKSFQETSDLSKSYTKSKLSVSADQKFRPKPKPVDRPLKEFRSDQTIGKPLKATKYFETKGQDWLDNCHGDYFPVPRQTPSEIFSGDKRNVQQRRNSTSFSTITIGDGCYSSQKHGVITASALMDLRTSIR